MLKKLHKFLSDLALGYAIYMSAVGIARFARDLRDHFRKTPQY